MTKIALFFSMVLLSFSATAQNIVFTVPGTPGGPVDTIARILQLKLESSGYKSRIEHRPGAGDQIGVNHHLSSTSTNGDIHLLVTTNSVLVNHYITKTSSVDVSQSLVPLLPLGSAKILIHAKKDLPAESLKDLDRLGLNRLTYGTPGKGTGLHMVGVWVSQYIQTPMADVPYKGVQLAMVDLASGNLDLAIDTGRFIDFAREGRTKIIAVVGSNEWTRVPGAKTLAEQNIPDPNIITSFVLFGHEKNPVGEQTKIAHILKTAYKSDPHFKKQVEDMYLEIPDTGAINDPVQWWKKQISNIKKSAELPVFQQFDQSKK